MSESQPPFNYLLACSNVSLESFELSRLNRIANLRKELREIVEEWIEAEVQARLARWILERRRAQDQALIPFPDSVASEEHLASSPRTPRTPPKPPCKLRAPLLPMRKVSDAG